MGILPGTDGEVKMSKSLGNHIPLLRHRRGYVRQGDERARQGHGAVLPPGDALDAAEIDALESGLAAGRLHPRDVKMKLAREIVSIYHGEEAASQAEEEFVRVFQQGRAGGDARIPAGSRADRAGCAPGWASWSPARAKAGA